MRGFNDLFASERGVFCVLMLIAATVLCAMKIITGDSWLSFAKYLAVALVASKTITGGIDQVLSGAATPPTASS